MTSPTPESSFPRDAVLARLGLSLPQSPYLPWLAEAYRAWTRAVPFTNLLKLKAIRAGEPLPSLEPARVMAQFLEDGSCGTCFTHALAFRALLDALGYH